MLEEEMAKYLQAGTAAAMKTIAQSHAIPAAKSINWKRVPKQALVDALRNTNQGPTHLSKQDKTDLVAIAERALLSDLRNRFILALQREVDYRAGPARWREVCPQI